MFNIIEHARVRPIVNKSMRLLIFDYRITYNSTNKKSHAYFHQRAKVRKKKHNKAFGWKYFLGLRYGPFCYRIKFGSKTVFRHCHFKKNFEVFSWKRGRWNGHWSKGRWNDEMVMIIDFFFIRVFCFVLVFFIRVSCIHIGNIVWLSIYRKVLGFGSSNVGGVKK